MKKIILYIFLLGLAVLISSCIILPNRKKGFSSFKKPLVCDRSQIFIKTSGVYVPLYGIGRPYFLFDNGNVQSHGWVDDFFQNPAKGIEDIKYYNLYSQKDYWGHYLIQSDTIIIQVFSRNNQEFFKRQVFEYKGVIKSDTSFVLLSGYNYHDKNQFMDKPITYQFYPTEIKPDSTRAWFNNRKWFKKGLHESRKPKTK